MGLGSIPFYTEMFSTVLSSRYIFFYKSSWIISNHLSLLLSLARMGSNLGNLLSSFMEGTLGLA